MPLFENNQEKEKSPENTNSESKGIVSMLGQFLPWAPLVYEQFTGQKIPAMSGTIAEIQMALGQIQSGMQTVVQNQQELNQRLTQLETNANSQLTNLVQQFQSLRLTHTKEKKEIACNNSANLEEY